MLFCSGTIKSINPFFGNDNQFTVEFITQTVDLVGSVPSDIKIVINTILNPERFRRVGAPLPKGILMIGAPGVGKTTIARYIAKETGCPIVISSAAQFINMFVGTGPAAIRSLFETARNHLQREMMFADNYDYDDCCCDCGPCGPCCNPCGNPWCCDDTCDDFDDYAYESVNVKSGDRVECPLQQREKKSPKPVIIFIDEIDSIGATRGTFVGAGMEERNTLNQLFTEMEGIRGCDNIIVIAASNEDEGFFDPALRSRFTYIAHVPLPGECDRFEILHYYAGNGMFAPGTSLDYLSVDAYTRGYAGRDLKKLVENIARIAANDMSFANDEVVITVNHIRQGYSEFNERKRREMEAEQRRRGGRHG